MKYLYNPPYIIKKVFSDFYWHTANDKILLTFDDGPVGGNTERILKLLNELKIKSLFFVVGGNCVKHPALIKEILSEGHELGNHTFNHKIPAKITRAALEKEIDELNDYVLNNFSYKFKYFRPPHGKFSLNLNRVLRMKEMKNVMWSLLTFDYKNDYKLVKFAVDNYLKKNSIVVLHDSLKSKDIITDSIKLIYDRSGELGWNIGETKECLK